jgi:uncharacterized protein YdcH (DUF465 family)
MTMEIVEAFRVALGTFASDRSLADTHRKETRYEDAVKQLLKTLRIADRLHFFRHSDAGEELDWLIVKIEASGQRSLLEDIDRWSGDLELSRECDAAVGLARVALSVFRKLISKSRMSPTEFHRLLAEGNQEHKTAMRMIKLADELGEGIVAMRSPEGHDDVARSFPIPRMVTLSEIEEGQFFVHMVGRTSALIFRSEGGSTSSRSKKIELHWGNGAMRQKTAARFYEAMESRHLVPVRYRATHGRTGNLVRLEWCPDAEAKEEVVNL